MGAAMLRRITVSLVGVLAACAMDTGKDGEEDGPLGGDGKADDISEAIAHGPVTFAIEQSLEIKKGQIHSWTFTLTDSAKIAIAPTFSTVDAVAYLFHRAPGATGWGTPLVRDDDGAGNERPLIEADLDAGEYMYILKGYKATVTGVIDLGAACEGGGCPSLDASPITRPGTTPFAAVCSSRMQTIVHSPVIGRAFMQVPAGGVDLLPSTIRRAGYYFASDARLAPDRWGRGLQFHVTYLEDGTLVDVRKDGSSDPYVYLLDRDDELVVATYDENTKWSCGDGTQAAAPSDLCVVWTNYNLMRAPSEEHDHAMKPLAEAAAELGNLATFAVEEYRKRVGAADDAELTVGGVTWDPDANTRSGGIDVEGPAGAARFFVSGSVYTAKNGWVFTQNATGSTAPGEFVCNQHD
jgi:hypothetical protein